MTGSGARELPLWQASDSEIYGSWSKKFTAPAGGSVRKNLIAESEMCGCTASRQRSQRNQKFTAVAGSGVRTLRIAKSEIYGCAQSDIYVLRGQNFTDVSGCGVRTLRITESETYSCVAGRLAEESEI